MRSAATRDVQLAELDLLIELASGKKTFEQVRDDARKFMFAGTGLEGLATSNASRGTTERLKSLTGIDKDSLAHFDVRCKADVDGRTVRSHPFSLLSSKIQRLNSLDPAFFDVALEAASSPDVVASTFTNSPEYLEHDLVQTLSGTAVHVVPVGLYSDGIKIGDDTHPDSLYVIYLSFLHRPTDEVARPGSKHLFTVYRKSECTSETLEDIWKILLWELQALGAGHLPKFGEEKKPLSAQSFGDPITGFHAFCLMQVKADWAWYVEALGVRQWNSLRYMCPFCQASKGGELTWHDFSLSANWLKTCRGHALFLDDLAASKRCGFDRAMAPFAFEPLLAQAPFFKWSMVKLDAQHALDLGTLSYELGEIWWSLLPRLASAATGGAHRDRSTGLKELQRRLKRYYSERRVDSKIPIKRLTLRKIKARRHPKLKAKAAQTRRLVPFTLELAAEFRDTDGEVGQHRLESMTCVSEIRELVSKRELTNADLLRWRGLEATHMFHYAKCGYRVCPKFHYALHLPAQAERGGAPRVFWVYSDESKNRDVRRIFGLCSKGHAVSQQILLRLDWLFVLKALRARMRMGCYLYGFGSTLGFQVVFNELCPAECLIPLFVTIQQKKRSLQILLNS